VDLSGSAINGEGLESIVNLPIRTLNLKNAPITSVGFRKIAKLEKLQELILDQCSIENPDSLAALSKLPGLRKLSLSRLENAKGGERGKVLTDVDLSNIAKIKSLEWLNIEANRRITSAGMRKLATLPNLKYLSISGIQFDSFVVESGRFRALEELYLSRVSVPAHDESGIEKLSALPALRTLDLRRCNISKASYARIAKIPGLRTINFVEADHALEGSIRVVLSKLRPSLHLEFFPTRTDLESSDE